MTTPTRPAPPIRYVVVEYGDDLRRIALRELGDAALWLDLVVLNELRPPYISDAPALGVLTYGDPIKIPAGFSSIEASSSPAELFGVDMMVLRDKQLSVSNGDFDLVSGMDNLSQALCRAVTVGKRELAFHPDYGCYVKRLLGNINGPTSGQLAAFYVRSTMLEDRRVDTVPVCTAEVLGDQISVDAEVVAITGRAAELRVVI